MGQHIDVFVSSTSQDLTGHRAAVKEAIIDLGLYPIMMENFPAEGSDAITRCKAGIAQAEVYVGIYAHRYGWVPGANQGGDGDQSITALEYAWAREKGIPTLCFVIEPKHPWPPGPPHFDAAGEKTLKLQRFKSQVMNEGIVNMFTTPDDLAQKVTASLHHAVRDLTGSDPTPGGWRTPTAPLLPHNFIGRDADRERITALLTDPDRTPVVLSGPGGLGKTFLAQHLARALDDAFPGGTLWASFGPEARHAASVVPPVLAQWAAHHPQGRALSADELTPDRVRGLLSDAPGRLLAVIDDVWHLPPLRELQAALPEDAAVLVTTRSARVASGAGRRYLLRTLPSRDGLALLQDRLRAAGDDPGPQRESLGVIVALLDGHALALDLAARQIAERGAAYAPRFVQRLQRHLDGATPFRLLALGEGRDDNLEAALFLSYEPLLADRQAAFRALGVLAPDADFDVALACAVWDVAPDDLDAVEDAEDALHDLVRAGLLRYDASTQRYSQHMLLHVYAGALAREQREYDRALSRYSRYVIHTLAAQFAALPLEQWQRVILPDRAHIHFIGDSLAGVDRPQSAREYGYIQANVLGDVSLAALAEPLPPATLDDIRAEIVGDDPPGMIAALIARACDFAQAVIPYVFHRRVAEGRRWLAAGLACARLQAGGELEYTLLGQLGTWHHQRGQQRDALAYYEEVLAMAREGGHTKAQATVLNNLGEAYRALGDLDTALTYYDAALTLARTHGDRGLEATTLDNLGAVYARQGQHEQAIAHHLEALPILRELDNRTGQATSLRILGHVYLTLAQYEQSLAYTEQALALWQAIGNPAGEAATLNNLASIRFVQGDYTRAITLLERVVELDQGVGSPDQQAVHLRNLAYALHESGEHTAEAIPYAERAVALMESHHLTEDASGGTLASHRAFLATLRRAAGLG